MDSGYVLLLFTFQFQIPVSVLETLILSSVSGNTYYRVLIFLLRVILIPPTNTQVISHFHSYDSTYHAHRVDSSSFPPYYICKDEVPQILSENRCFTEQLQIRCFSDHSELNFFKSRVGCYLSDISSLSTRLTPISYALVTDSLTYLGWLLLEATLTDDQRHTANEMV